MFAQTKLSPLEEALFQTWARAHGVDSHDDPNNSFDYRGHYKQTNGALTQPKMLADMAQAHNEANAPDESSGDVTFPDPYMAQAEMHKATLDAQTKTAANDQKLQIEQMKMQHTSGEKEKDRQHKVQLEQMKQQQKAEADARNMQMRQQEAQANRQAQEEQAERDRQYGVQDSMMQEHFARTRPQPQPTTSMPNAGGPQGNASGTAPGGMNRGMPQGQGAPGAQPFQRPGSALQDQLMNREMGR